MGKASDLQVMQEVMRGLLMSLCVATTVDRTKLAMALSAFSLHPGIEPQARACLQDLAQGMTAIAPPGGPKQ